MYLFVYQPDNVCWITHIIFSVVSRGRMSVCKHTVCFTGTNPRSIVMVHSMGQRTDRQEEPSIITMTWIRWGKNQEVQLEKENKAQILRDKKQNKILYSSVFVFLCKYTDSLRAYIHGTFAHIWEQIIPRWRLKQRNKPKTHGILNKSTWRMNKKHKQCS